MKKTITTCDLCGEEFTGGSHFVLLIIPYSPPRVAVLPDNCRFYPNINKDLCADCHDKLVKLYE